MSTKATIGRERWCDDYPAPLHVDQLILAAATAETYTVPTDCNHVVIFPYTPTATEDEVAVRWDGSTAVLPAADVTDGSGSELIPVRRPTARQVDPGSTFSIISIGIAHVTIACRRTSGL